MANRPLCTIGLSLLLVAPGCDSARNNSACDATGGQPVALEAGSCLVFEDADQLATHRDLVERVVRETVASVNGLMPTDGIVVRVVADPAGVIPELGLSGYNPATDEVIIYVDPGSARLPGSLETNLGPVLAHEIHHARRRQSVGYGATLFEAAVTEGLADHFAVEVFGGEPPIWSTALDGDDLAIWTERAAETWSSRPYDHGGWFVGTDPDIPRWAGYAIGFELVRVVLAADPERRASTLVDEPATSFLPTAEGD